MSRSSSKARRHIEVQVLGDGHDVIHCFERECSLQRRRQKVWEEAPSPSLTPAIREKLCSSAVALAKAVHYRGAGTLEYLYDDRSHALLFPGDEHAHPGRASGDGDGHRHRSGARDDPDRRRRALAHPPGSGARHTATRSRSASTPRTRRKASAPNPGTVTALSVPGGNGVRFDSMLYAGYTVPPFYDSLLGKLIVHDEDRASAIATSRSRPR